HPTAPISWVGAVGRAHAPERLLELDEPLFRRILWRRAATEGETLVWPCTIKSEDETPMTARVAIVTCASSGIGLGITVALRERGYRVVANSRTISESKDLRPSANLLLVDGDIGKKETAIEVADAAVRHFDGIDLLVNNAGIYLPKPFTEYTPEDFAR